MKHKNDLETDDKWEALSSEAKRRTRNKRIIVILAIVLGIVGVILAINVGKNISRSIDVMQLANRVDSVNVGDIIEFGAYNASREWLVLDKRDKQLLIISKECVGYFSYEEGDDHNWEDCIIRDWLNSHFYDTSFVAAERARIMKTDVVAEANPKYNTAIGNDTQDYIFLLSIDEACKYFKNDSARQCFGKGYYYGNQYWWLRSLGEDMWRSAFVSYSGVIDYEGSALYKAGVRPAMWINLE